MPEDELSTEEALEGIREVQDKREPLARRTSGLTWMVLGVTLAAISVSYYLLFELIERGPLPRSPYLFASVWIPWAMAGVAMTRQLWRSAGLSIPGLEDGRGWLRALLLVAIVVVGLAAGFEPWTSLPAPSLFLLAIGATSIGMGSTGIACNDAFERRMWIGAGVATVLGVLAGLALVPGPMNASKTYNAFAAIGPLLILVVYVGGGWIIARTG